MTSRFGMLVGVLAVAGCGVAFGEATAGAAGEKAAATAPATRPAGKVAQPLPDEKGRPFAVVEKVEKAPKIDGKIDEDIYGEKPTLTGFFDEFTGKSVPGRVQTQVWLVHDKDTLYIAAKMLEPAMAELVADETERDASLWSDDTFQIFLDPGKTKDPAEYYQLAVNPAGALTDVKGAPDVLGDLFWDCRGCKVKVEKGKDAWVVEMAVPLKGLGVKEPAAGQRWGANFARERKAGAAENSTWVNMGPSWHQPDKFGTIVFAD